MWNKVCTTVGRTTIKMNGHFVPRFFHLFAGSEHSEHRFARSACLPVRLQLHLKIFPFWLLEAWPRHRYKKYLEIDEV